MTGDAHETVTGGEKKWVRWKHGQRLGDGFRSLRQLCDDPRSWVPCCGGIVGLGGHHGQLDHSRTLRIARADLPLAVEEFAAELGLEHWLSREYGELTNTTSMTDPNPRETA